ncbi:MAG: lipid II flippase MurJ, partial [Planctomycetota bacterium]
ARDSAKQVLRRFGPVMIGMGALQINTLADTAIAMWPVWVGPMIFGTAYPLDVASNSVLGFTQRLYQFPLGVFGIAVATAVFPMLARAADREADFADTLRRGLRLSLFIGLPASVGLIAVRHDLTAVIYGGPASAFSDDGLARSAAVLLGYATAVWAYSLNQVLARAFYARGDTATPMRISLVMVAINLAAGLSLMWPLGEAGLAWATAIAACLQFVLLAWLVRHKLGVRIIEAGSVRTIATAAVGSALVAVTVWGLGLAFGPPQSWATQLVRLVACTAAGAGAYAVWSWLARCPELRWLISRGRA